MMSRKILNRTIIILSLVSLFADVASEMLYPVVPAYLQNIGFPILLIGILEGLAELVVGLSKGYFGKLSDEKGVRLPFIKFGYFLSAISKPMMGFLVHPLWIFFARSTDRLGKGIRNAARDALLSQQATPENKARVFGFHRAFDTIGAATGPMLALLFLHFYPGKYVELFYLAFIPGLISVALIYLLREKKQPAAPSTTGFFSFFYFWKQGGPQYRRLSIGLLIFILANSSDVFLLLKAKEITGNDTITISAYILYNLVYAFSSYPMGVLGDRIGIRPVYISGLILFAIVYTGFAFNTHTIGIYILFVLYGIYAAATEGLAKAWLTNIIEPSRTATGLGLFNSLQSLTAFVSSLIAGLIWTAAGSQLAFAISAVLAIMATILLSRLTRAKA